MSKRVLFRIISDTYNVQTMKINRKSIEKIEDLNRVWQLARVVMGCDSSYVLACSAGFLMVVRPQGFESLSCH